VILIFFPLNGGRGRRLFHNEQASKKPYKAPDFFLYADIDIKLLTNELHAGRLLGHRRQYGVFPAHPRERTQVRQRRSRRGWGVGAW
jgi:hypothetical protein